MDDLEDFYRKQKDIMDLSEGDLQEYAERQVILRTKQSRLNSNSATRKTVDLLGKGHELEGDPFISAGGRSTVSINKFPSTSSDCAAPNEGHETALSLKHIDALISVEPHLSHSLKRSGDPSPVSEEVFKKVKRSESPTNLGHQHGTRSPPLQIHSQPADSVAHCESLVIYSINDSAAAQTAAESMRQLITPGPLATAATSAVNEATRGSTCAGKEDEIGDGTDIHDILSASLHQHSMGEYTALKPTRGIKAAKTLSSVKSGTRVQAVRHGKLAVENSDISTPEPSSDEGKRVAESADNAKQVKNGAQQKQSKSRTKAKEPKVLVSPLEYAEKLREKIASRGQSEPSGWLQGKRIIYVGGDMTYAGDRTKRRMELIVKNGGTLVAEYHPLKVTHIVTDAKERATLRALKLKSLHEIPDEIPTVTWSWVISGMGRSKRMGAHTQDESGQDHGINYEFMHEAFHSRIKTDLSLQRKHRKKSSTRMEQLFEVDVEASRISEFTQDDLKASPTNKVTEANPSKFLFTPKFAREVEGEGEDTPAHHDPLEEFYSQAKADRDAAWSHSEGESEFDAGRRIDDSDDEIEDSFSREGPAPRRGFACDNKEIQRRGGPNQDIAEKLEELMEIHKAKPTDDDRWRAFSYGKCLRALRNHPTRIKSFSEARSIRGVGEKTALKIMEIMQTGSLRRIGFEKTDDVEATSIFQGIYGVGRSIAYKWYAAGCRTLEDVRARKGGVSLTSQQEVGVKYYDDKDINDRMPRREAQALFDIIKPIALQIDARLFVEIMGSFRRGKSTCGDIDILITRPMEDGKTHSGVLKALLAALHAADILTEDLNLPENFSDLENIYRGLCRLPEPGARRRRIDFLTVPWTSRGAALLYYTGDDIFNRAMRLKASVYGYSLNQRGLFAGVVRDPRNRMVKLNEGYLLASETEEEIFKILDVPWQEPHERVRG